MLWVWSRLSGASTHIRAVRGSARLSKTRQPPDRRRAPFSMRQRKVPRRAEPVFRTCASTKQGPSNNSVASCGAVRIVRVFLPRPHGPTAYATRVALDVQAAKGRASQYANLNHRHPTSEGASAGSTTAPRWHILHEALVKLLESPRSGTPQPTCYSAGRAMGGFHDRWDPRAKTVQ